MEKDIIINHLNALERYNQWEKKAPIGLAPDKRILMVCDLYQLIPNQNRKRVIDVSGIIRMRRALSLLKSQPTQ